MSCCQIYKKRCTYFRTAWICNARIIMDKYNQTIVIRKKYDRTALEAIKKIIKVLEFIEGRIFWEKNIK